MLEFLVRFLTEVSRRSEFATPRVAFMLSWPDRWGTTPMDELLRAGSGEDDPNRERCLTILREAGAFTGKELEERSENHHRVSLPANSMCSPTR
jgi:hypothetical protein